MSKRYISLKDYPGPNQTQTHEWATFLLSRNVQFKVHENRGHALNALKDTHAGILYKWLTFLTLPIYVTIAIVTPNDWK